MRITFIELENIKSYGAVTRIELTAGLNAVCGHNGSGKTTLLEVIGWVLFDFLPYRKGALLREGRKTGRATVGLLASDGRRYEVVRTIGSGASYAVFDAETSARLVERKEAVLEWVRRQALDIEGDADLAALFKNAVGVPQGTMTADFLQSATARKSIFDPLLRVEEYLAAVEELRTTLSFLQRRIAQSNEEIAGLSAQASRIPEIASQIQVLQERMCASEARIFELADQLLRVRDDKEGFDRLERHIAELKQERRLAEAERERMENALREQTGLLAKAEEAARIVTTSEPAYQRVLHARERLTQLEVVRRQRDALEAQIADLQATVRVMESEMEQSGLRRAEAVAAGEKAASLLPEVTAREELELRVRKAGEELRDAARLSREFEELGTEIGRLEREIEEVARKLGEARAASTRAEDLQRVQGECSVVAGQLAQLEAVRFQKLDVEKEGHIWADQCTRRAAEVAERTKLKEQYERKAGQSTLLECLDKQKERATVGLTRVLASLEYHEVAREDLTHLSCPLLSVTCPVVSADVTVLDRFDARERDWQQQRRGLERELQDLRPRMAEAEAAKAEIQRLQVAMGRYEDSVQALKEAERRRDEYRERYRALSLQLQSEAGLDERNTVLQRELRDVQEAVTMAGQAPLLQQQQERDQERLLLCREDMERCRQERARLDVIQVEWQTLRAELESADPRGEYNTLLALSNQLPAIERTLAGSRTRLKEARAAAETARAGRNSFATLDADLDRNRAVEADGAQAFELYLSNRDASRTVEDRRRTVDQLKESAVAVAARLSELAGLITETDTKYDPHRHAECRERYDTLTAERGGEIKTKELVLADIQSRNQELERLARTKQKLESRESECDELQRVEAAVAFARETIKSAGPGVTEALLSSISAGACEIYTDVVDDHAAELRWERDYAAVVQRGTETRDFAQLSGGEQMSAALAIRLALLKEMSEVDFAFFDEPTQSMDGERRANLADQIQRVHGFEQLIVISHDDTFEHHTDNLIRLSKTDEETHLDRV